MLFLEALQRTCHRQPDKVALECLEAGGTLRVRYGQLEATVGRAVAFLKSRGVGPGDRVALQLPKGLAFIYLHLAAMRLGAVSLPLNPGFPTAELDYYLRDSEAKLYVGDAGRHADFGAALETIDTLATAIFLGPDAPLETLLPDAPVAAPALPPDDPDATTLMIYTSGTTGRPKGAELTHGNLTANLDALHQAWEWQQDDVLLHVLPIFHTHGLVVALHGALHAGASAVLTPAFDAGTTLELLLTKRFSVLMAVPTIHTQLLDETSGERFDLSHLRLMTSGSARLPDDLFETYRTTFNHTLLERYGMTETGMNLSNPFRGERRVGSVGLPLPGVEARIVDPDNGVTLADGAVGEVQVRGPHVFKGYWRQPEKTAQAFTADGWLRTGDLGLREPDGYITLKGRSKDLIISGGFNIYPPEVERVLLEHPEVSAAAVIGCPDRDWGERVVAVVVLQDGAAATPEAILDHCRVRLAGYKAPKEVRVSEGLPRNAMGKVQKATLRAELCQAAP